MPDVHLAKEVCVGIVLATQDLIYPAAIGGDIGCGVSAMPFNVSAERVTADLLAPLQRLIPIRTRDATVAVELPQSLQEKKLSSSSIERLKCRDGTLSFGTIGRGNHFFELSEDAFGRLWALVHSGSRGMGPAIQGHHRRIAQRRSHGFDCIEADSEQGQAYLSDLSWARRYASESRRLIITAAAAILEQTLGAEPLEEEWIDCDHNHVQHEEHSGRMLWIHRKGSLEARDGQAAVIPGSMGTPTYLVEGRGCEAALRSSSHGAGRALSRTAARQSIAPRLLLEEAQDVVFDRRKASGLVEEAPSAYKSIDAVMRAQRRLTRIRGVLHPVLNHKGV